jgi:hypothetical protein
MIGVGEGDRCARHHACKIADFLEEGSGRRRRWTADLLRADHDRDSGVVVGGIVIAMYMPIFDLISKLA